MNIALTQKVAGIRASKLPFFSTVDSEDLAQESIMCQMMGRNSIDGPMIDLMRREIFFTGRRGKENLARVKLEKDDLHREIFITRETPETILSKSEISEVSKRIKILISWLPKRDQLILKLFFWDGLTCLQIAKQLNVTESRICQLKKESLRILSNARRN